MKPMKKWLLLIAVIALLPATASSQSTFTVNPRFVSFEPSVDHDKMFGGEPVVARYEMRIYLPGATDPISAVDLGKPTPVSGLITAQPPVLLSIPVFTEYIAKVAAIAPDGQEGVSDASGPFGRRGSPGQPKNVTVGR